MKREFTIPEFFQYLKKTFFPDVEVEKVKTFTEPERQTFLLEQLERLLTPSKQGEPLAARFSDCFWTADENRRPMMEINPCLNPQSRLQMKEEERELCSFYVTLSGLCHDVYLHFPFDLMQLDIQTPDEDFLYSNEVLTEWLQQTPYVHVAANIAWIMRNQTLGLVTDYYQPAQDFLAEIYDKQLGLLSASKLREASISPSDFLSVVLKKLKVLENHIQEGLRIGYCMEEIILHDELVGFLPDTYVEWMPDLVHELYQYEQGIYETLDLKDLDPDKDIRKQTPQIQEEYNRFEKLFLTKVRILREKYELKGWFEDDSLAFGYLVEHAHMKVYGVFNQ